ncbi:methionine synthase [Thermoflavimicrobium dichotomicum]|uniref:Methionine synthase n=1 Tax=Thermoflavimicrobium dichotomicum TaxID=46223 RepID=A0A1I3SKF8_9BACL|nr:methionine synthase [Thermoflavimicrobium dichotomicum]SFJ58189.1 5-methyltetrahydrofolate--homocysteine methyltransferase [Thermoflavimicrobium dichotomicum]
MQKKAITERLKEKILIIDGAMGTMLQQANLTVADFGGEEYEGCNEHLNLTRPDLIREIHASYYRAGADIVETNTFGATPIVLAEYGLQDQTEEINLAAARCAIEARDAWSTPEWPRYVAGAMGPTTKTLSVTGGATFDEMIESYYRQAKALIQGGVDLLLLETSQDTLNVKAGSIGIRRAFAELGVEIPIMISGTIEPMGTMLAGQGIEAFYLSIEHLKPIAVGLNCATGPEFMKDHIRTLSSLATCAVSCYPNAGLPDEDGNYLETPQALAQKLADFADAGWLNMAGGCCGTTPDHIRAIAEVMKGKKPRQPVTEHLPAVSGIEPVYLEPDNRPLLVGERTNVIGSRKFKRLIAEGKYEEAAEIARKQVKGGAQIIDVCLADPDRDELADMEAFLQYVTKKVKVPLMIDSTDPKVMERALTYSQGKAVINSINLEDGEKRFEEVVPLIHRFGAAVVVGTIDEVGMAVTKERKLEVAKRSYDLLVNKYGLSPQDIIFDPLVFPVGTGDEQYIGSALDTVEGIRLIKEAMPECATILGISNVSFGLPGAGREVLNAVFLYECTKAGLDYAIVNTEKLERYASIPEEERRLAEKLLFETTHENYEQVLNEFTAFYREKKVEKKEPISHLSLEERLARYVVEGTKDGLFEDLDEALKKYTPLDIINGPLMAGMDEVGRLFNDNQLIVAEVLQSAEVMKASVAYLEPHMDKAETHTKGKVLLATVKGDVHDIGKNLVEIILSNNGYEVVNLGIKVQPETLIEAVRKEKPDIIGLSGLLVKSAQQMVITAQDLKAAKIDLPILVGGAALTRKFTETRIAPEYDGLVLYAKDAMNGLELANRLVNPADRERLEEAHQEKLAKNKESAPQESTGQTTTSTITRSPIDQSAPVFVPPDLKRHIFRDVPLGHLRPYLNEQMLLGKHLGIRGKVEELIQAGDEKTVELKNRVDELLAYLERDQVLRPQGMYQFFPAQADGNDILIYDPEDQSRVIERFSFPRQSKPPYLCLADFLKPVESGVVDFVGFLAVTAGDGVRELSEQWKNSGDYLLSHMLQALALELAEAFAERLHQVMRDRWGFPDPVEMTMKERFGARYQGIRVSFGYPACPDLEDQKKLFRLIKPEDIGIQLTEGCMMEPEASVSAMVFAHPQARYFNAV